MSKAAFIVLALFACVVAQNYICNNVAWGAYVGDNWYSSTLAADSQAFDKNVGRNSQIAHMYINWDDDYQGPNGNDFSYSSGVQGAIQTLLTYNSVGNVNSRIPLITWQAWHSPYQTSNNHFDFTDIANGVFDTYITSFFTTLAKYNQTIYVRVFHEFDGNWYPWGATVNGNSAALFVAAWKHIYNIKLSTNANKVSLVWCPNNANSNNVMFEPFYPGDAYVQWVGLDAYSSNSYVNFNQTVSTAAAPTNPYARLVALTNGNKPIMIAEFGVIVNGGPSYTQWIANMMVELQSLPNIKAVVLFNAQSYAVTFSSSVTSSFTASLTGGSGSCTTGFPSLNASDPLVSNPPSSPLLKPNNFAVVSRPSLLIVLATLVAAALTL